MNNKKIKMHDMKWAKWIGTCMLFISTTGFGQKLLLDSKWKYSVVDNKSFSTAAFDDSGWQEMKEGSLLLDKDVLGGKAGYAVLRRKIIIPSGLRKGWTDNGAIALFLGRIYQADDVYFNGRLIGSTNSSDIKRIYIIQEEDIQWDKENVVAIRMRHWGDKSGLETPKPYIDAALPSAVFKLNATADIKTTEQAKGKKAVYVFNVTNRSTRKADATVDAGFYDLTGKQLARFSRKLILDSGKNAVRFPYSSPASFVKVKYTLTVPRYSYTTEWNDEFGYQDVVYKPSDRVVANKVKDLFSPADPRQQVIKGWLGDRMHANEDKRLLEVDEEALLAGFINRPGSHPWIGEHVGKFLDAAANTYRNSNGEALKILMDRAVQRLIAAQLPDGYLGTYAPESHWTSWDVWSHKYNIIGLLNYYSLSGFKPSLEAARKAGDLLCRTFGYGPGQRDLITAGTHVGMASTSVLEPMVDLYRYTGDKKYLDFCYFIIKSMDQENGPKILPTLKATGGRVDKTANAKAYEMLSNFLGIVKLYQVTGDTRFLTPVLLAWKDIVSSRLYITGTASSFEHFKEDGDLPATDKDNMGEGCVTTTWVQLNYQLLCVTGEMKYLDEVERSVYNHLTGAENPQSGCVSYYTPLQGIKPYRCVITCCMSSVPRGISMIPLFANGKITGQPSFLFYQPGTYTTTISGSQVAFTTTTGFPADSSVNIQVNTLKPQAFGVVFRKPYWAADFAVRINGVLQADPGKEIITINRTWNKNDQVAITFRMPLIILDGGKSYPSSIAIQRGPQVLAYDKSLNKTDINNVSIGSQQPSVSLAANILSANWIGKQVYQVDGYSQGKPEPVFLVPYADAGQSGGSIQTWLPAR